MKVQEEEAAKDAQAPKALRKEDLTFNGPVGRAVFDAVFTPVKRHFVKDMFLPRRTAFVYDFDPTSENYQNDIPTTLRRSKADCPPVQVGHILVLQHVTCTVASEDCMHACMHVSYNCSCCLCATAQLQSFLCMYLGSVVSSVQVATPLLHALPYIAF